MCFYHWCLYFIEPITFNRLWARAGSEALAIATLWAPRRASHFHSSNHLIDVDWVGINVQSFELIDRSSLIGSCSTIIIDVESTALTPALIRVEWLGHYFSTIKNHFFTIDIHFSVLSNGIGKQPQQLHRVRDEFQCVHQLRLRTDCYMYRPVIGTVISFISLNYGTGFFSILPFSFHLFVH